MESDMARGMWERRRGLNQAVVEVLEQRRLLAAGGLAFAHTFAQREQLDTGNAIATDASGNIYFTGSFKDSLDLDPTKAGKAILRSDGDANDVFVAKYTPAGRFLWARRFGGPEDDVPNLIRVGPSGDVYVTGTYSGPANFGTAKAPHILPNRGDLDAFVMRLRGSDGKPVWAGHIGGERDDAITAMDVGSQSGRNGDVLFIAGTFRLAGDLDPGKKVRNFTALGTDDTFIEQLNAGTGRLVGAPRVFGENDTREGVASVVVDPAGGVFVAGSFIRSVQFDRGDGAFDRESSGGDDVYLGHLTDSLNWDFIDTMGGGDTDTVADMARSSSGDLYLTGNFQGTVTFAAGIKNTLISQSDSDAYVTKVAADGTVEWARGLGSPDGTILPHSIAVDDAGNVYTTGTFFDAIDFDPGAGEAILTTDKSGDAPILSGQQGASDVYVSKLTSDGAYSYVSRIGGNEGTVSANGLAADASGNVFLAGTFLGTIDFKPGPGKLIRKSFDTEDESDAYFLKLVG